MKLYNDRNKILKFLSYMMTIDSNKRDYIWSSLVSYLKDILNTPSNNSMNVNFTKTAPTEPGWYLYCTTKEFTKGYMHMQFYKTEVREGSDKLLYVMDIGHTKLVSECDGYWSNKIEFNFID